MQFFVAMDAHANWSRRVKEEIESFTRWGQYDMAAKAQAQLDEAQSHDVVHQIMQVQPAKH